MGKLSQFTEGISNIRTQLDDADSVKGNMDSMLEGRFSEVNENLGKAMQNLVSESNKQQNDAFRLAVEQAVLAVTQNNQIVLNSLNRMSQEAQKGQDGLNSNINSTGKAGSVENKALQAKLETVLTDISKIPTQFPKQIKTDLSGLDKAIMAVGLQVDSIPTAKFPDMSGNFSKMEKKITDLQKKLATRVHVFEIERDSMNGDLVKRIVVRTK